MAEIELAPDETVAGKPFVDPRRTREDAEALRRLCAEERQRALAWADESSGWPRNVVIRETDPDGRRHLLVVPDARALLDAPSPTVVGFFGRPRADADHALLFGLEDELVASMAGYAADGLLSYYDVEIVKGAYGNLILFATPDGPVRWRENPIHSRAVQISPRNYHEIRLHEGVLSGRLVDGGALRLIRTRYLDYSEGEVWRAVRRILEPAGA
jgi:hypothetical protein